MGWYEFALIWGEQLLILSAWLWVEADFLLKSSLWFSTLFW